MDRLAVVKFSLTVERNFDDWNQGIGEHERNEENRGRGRNDRREG